MELAAVKKKFEALYAGAADGVVRAPGRVNLIGEHTDYNGGFVLPIAIERQTVALYARRDVRQVRFASAQADARAAVDLDRPIAPGEPAWANYCRGVAAGLVARGVELVGCDILLDSNIPLGGGLSSSASLEVATATALLAAAGRPDAVPPRELAQLCQAAEHEFAGAPCGIMDQSVVIMGQSGQAMLLDCRSGRIRHIPFDDAGVVLLVADTQVHHDIADGGYAARRDQCYAAAETLGVKMLRDADEAMVLRAGDEGRLVGKELMRARHVVGEIARSLAAVEVLKAGDYHRFGELMYGSHASCRDDYEISCDELNAVVDAAAGCAGVYGARMTGGGFGGCAIILAEAGQAQQAAQAVQDSFAGRFDRRCPVFATRAADGASMLTLT